MEGRRRSFALGRAAAREALSQLDCTAGAIGKGPGGEPLWPEGFVGTISHSGDLAVAVVGRRADYDGLGVDVEQRSPGLSARGARLVCTPAEFDWVDQDPSSTRRTLLFSAKEAIFKALYPIERIWLGFGDAELTWDAERGGFDARLLKAAGQRYPVDTLLHVRCAISALEVLSLTYVGVS